MVADGGDFVGTAAYILRYNTWCSISFSRLESGFGTYKFDSTISLPSIPLT